MKPLLLMVAALMAFGCEGQDNQADACYRDADGLVWTNKRLMNSYGHRRDQINGINLCYPHVGLTRTEIGYGRPCPHPRQKIQDGWCRCTPYPDVLFDPEDVLRWCKKVQ